MAHPVSGGTGPVPWPPHSPLPTDQPRDPCKAQETAVCGDDREQTRSHRHCGPSPLCPLSHGGSETTLAGTSSTWQSGSWFAAPWPCFLSSDLAPQASGSWEVWKLQWTRLPFPMAKRKSCFHWQRLPRRWQEVQLSKGL